MFDWKAAEQRLMEWEGPSSLNLRIVKEVVAAALGNPRMRDTTTRGLTFTRPIPQGTAPPEPGAFWTDEYGWLVLVEDADE